MTATRSRKVLPNVSPNTSKGVSVIEPVTPARNLEFLNHFSSITNPNSTSSSQNTVPVKVKVLETGMVRRRSLRLAKIGESGYVDSVEAMSGEGMEVELEEEDIDSSSSEEDEGSLDPHLNMKVHKSLGETVKLEMSSSNGKRKRKLSEEVKSLDMKVHESLGETVNLEMSSSNGKRKRKLSEGVKLLDMKVHKSLGETVKLEMSSSNGKRKRKLSEEVKSLDMKVDKSLGETVNLEMSSNGKRKRKLSEEVKSLDIKSGVKDEASKRILNLRSAKRVVKEEIMLSGDVLVKSISEASMEQDKNPGSLRRADKGKGKVGYGTSAVSEPDASELLQTQSLDSKEVAKDEGSSRINSGLKARRLTRAEKGKMKTNGSSSNDVKQVVKVESVENHVAPSIQPAESAAFINQVQASEYNANANANANVVRTTRQRYRNIARRIASRFAHFTSQDELGNQGTNVSGTRVPNSEPDTTGIEDWPGPFSTAMKIIKDREPYVASSGQCGPPELNWAPSKDLHRRGRPFRTLQELCLSALVKDADAITSFDFIPDMLRHQICWDLCDERKMNAKLLELLVDGSPTEIRLRDCSWLSEELFTKIFEGCILDKLTVLQFDQGGVCLPDYTLSATLARSPNCLPALITLSLKGAYRLTDVGLRTLVSAAPNLKSVDLSQCSMITSDGINCLANSLKSVLRELYINNCQGLEAMSILPALSMLEKLEVLSIARLPNVSDNFISKLLSACGSRMKEIVLADCMELTDLSLKVIGDKCPGLRALDLTNVCKLTDIGICHLANGCEEIQMLKLRRINAFSDQAVGAYLHMRGDSLKELSLNHCTEVSNHTAISLAQNCRNLQTLDLSWCRKLTNEALGLIVDSCSSLNLLKLFGSTQLTDVFINGHSNPRVKLIGLKMDGIFKHINVPDFLQGPLRYP